MILQDIEIHFHNPSLKEFFNGETFHLCDFLLRILGKYKTPNTRKIILIFEEIGKDIHVAKERNKPFVLADTIEYFLNFDFQNYERSNIEKKKAILWDSICDAIKDIATKLQWSVNEIKQAKTTGINLKLENSFIHIKSKYSKNRIYKAQIKSHFDFYSFKSFLEIYNKEDELIISKKILERNPNFGWYDSKLFNVGQWVNNVEYKFGRKDGREEILVNIEKELKNENGD